MGKKLAEARNWNPINEEIVKGAFAVAPSITSLVDIVEVPKSEEKELLQKKTICKEVPTFKQFRMAEADSLIVERLLTGLRAHLGVKVTFTDLVHAMVFMVDKKREPVLKEAQSMIGKLLRPQLADGPAMREFQRSLAMVLLDGISGESRFM